MHTMMLKEILKQAAASDYAIGHFNFADSVVLCAIVQACQKLKSPVFVGTSEGESRFLGYKQAVALKKAWQEVTGLPVFLNADHHKSFERAKEAVDAGYDSIKIDGTERSFEENMAVTKKVVEYAKNVNPDISVEGEIGYIRGSSKLHREVVEIRPEDMTSPQLSLDFVEETGVDRLAVVIGNIHGIALQGNPRLDIDRLGEIHKIIPQVPITLHGGSGILDKDIRATLPLGMSNIHVNTEIRVAFTAALRDTFEKHPDQTTPYEYFHDPLEAAQQVVEKKLRLFRAVDIV